MVAAALPAPPLPPPSAASLRRTPTATSSSTCFSSRVGLRHLCPFVESTFRHGRNSLSHFRIHLRIGSAIHDVFAVPECPRVVTDGFEFRVGSGRKSRGALARAAASGAGTVGGKSGSFNNWTGAVDGSCMQEILILVLKNMEIRQKRRTPSNFRPSVVIGTAILTSILASRSAVGRVLAAACCATMVVALFLKITFEDEKLQLIFSRFHLLNVRAGDQLHGASEAITKIAHISRWFPASRILSGFPTMAGECEACSAGIVTSGGSLVIPAVGRDSKNSSTEHLALHGKPEMTKVASDISQSIANLIIVINTAEVAASRVDSRSRLEFRVQELQSVKDVLPAQQNEFHSKQNHTAFEAPDSETAPGFLSVNFGGSKGLEELATSQMVECSRSDGRTEDVVPILHHSISVSEQRTSGQQLPRISRLVNEAYETSTSHELNNSESIPLESIKEPLHVAPPIFRNGPIRNAATQGTMIGEGLPSEGMESNICRGPPMDSDVVGKSSNSEGDYLVGIQNILPVTDSLVEEQVPVSNEHSRSMATKMAETQRTRSSFPDPWLVDYKSRPVEQDGEWSRRKLSNGSQLPGSILIVNGKSETKIPITDGNGNVRGVNRNGRVDFWGKNAGIMLKASEQRGTLTKSKATGKGSSFGSVDDMGDDQPQERRRSFLEEEQQNLFRRGLPSSSSGGQPWNGKQQPNASRRESVRGDQRMRGDSEDGAAAGQAGSNSPETLIRGTDSDVTMSSPLHDTERWAQEGTSQSRDGLGARGDVMSPAPVEIRASPSRQMDSTMMSNSGFSRSRQRDGRSGQLIDETGVLKGKYSGSKGVWDAAPNSEQKVYAVPGDGSRNGRYTPASSGNSQSQSEMTRSNLATQGSRQNPDLLFDNYLDEAEALMEQGMQGLEGRIEVGVAEALMEQGMQGLEGRIEVGVAERMLNEAANLLESASEIYPDDLAAVGQWGNSLLVHGQLKLKLSQQLRSILLSPKSGSPLMRGERPIADLERESMEVTLQEVCEECEELLVDAGRKFRRALSLDNKDVRALYNWGLALCYRGQLISQEGGERAMEDADKLYLAAIDKFEAILGVSQDYAPGALLNWGLAMLDRSRLRDMGDKERVQLLLQAKELFQDAVRLDPNYGQARGAVAVCSAELKELQGFEAPPRRDATERPNRNWWQR